MFHRLRSLLKSKNASSVADMSPVAEFINTLNPAAQQFCPMLNSNKFSPNALADFKFWQENVIFSASQLGVSPEIILLSFFLPGQEARLYTTECDYRNTLQMQTRVLQHNNCGTAMKLTPTTVECHNAYDWSAGGLAALQLLQQTKRTVYAKVTTPNTEWAKVPKNFIDFFEVATPYFSGEPTKECALQCAITNRWANKQTLQELYRRGYRVSERFRDRWFPPNTYLGDSWKWVIFWYIDEFGDLFQEHLSGHEIMELVSDIDS